VDNTKEKVNSMKKILVVNLGGIGDVLLAQPSLRLLKQSGVELSVAVVERAFGLLSRWDFVDEVIPIALNSKIDLFKKLLYLRKKNYDLAINMRTIHSKLSAVKVRMMFKIINADSTAGRNTDNRASFFNLFINEKEYGGKHEIEYCSQQVKELGIENIESDIKWYWQEDDLKIIDEMGLKNYAVVHPGAAVESKRWPLNRFKAIVEYLLKEKVEKVVITGSIGEKQMVDKVSTVFDENVVNLAGKTSLLESAAVIYKSSIVVTNDTGLMHIAASMNKPLVVVFGPGDLTRYDPRVLSSKANVLHKETKCAPCEKYKCKDNKCLKQITVKEVKQAIDEIL